MVFYAIIILIEESISGNAPGIERDEKMSYDSKQYSEWSCCFIPITQDQDLWDKHIHSHTTEELLLIVTKGHCVIDNNGSTYQVPTPAFIWNRAGSYHKIVNAPDTSGTSFLLSFVFDILDDVPKKMQFADFMDGCGLFALPLNSNRLERMTDLFSVLVDSPLPQRQLLFPCIFHQLGMYLKAGAEPIVSSDRHEYISQVLALLEGVKGAKMTSKQLAEHFHVSRNKLESDFKQATGQTVYEYRTQMQLQSARVLLATTNQPLVEIAQACGFTDQSHLIRSFRKKFGTTPGVFREQHRKKPR